MLIVIFMLSAMPVMATDNISETELSIVKEYVKRIKIDRNKILKMIEQEGFTYNEAEHYYIVDEMIKFMQRNNMSFDNIIADEYTNEKILSNIEGFKKKIREVDLSSIITAINNAEKINERVDELKDVVASYGSDLPSKIVIKYDDGSTVEYRADLHENEVISNVMVSPESNAVINNFEVLGIQEKIFNTGTFTSYNTYNGSSEVYYKNPIAYTKLRLETNTTYNSSGAKINAVDCLTSTYGAISVSNKLNYISNYSTYDAGVGDVVWVFSGAAGISLKGTYGLSFSVTVGKSWTEQLIHRYYDSGNYDKRTKIYH